VGASAPSCCGIFWQNKKGKKRKLEESATKRTTPCATIRTDCAHEVQRHGCSLGQSGLGAATRARADFTTCKVSNEKNKTRGEKKIEENKN
jgi:hypothetical protein